MTLKKPMTHLFLAAAAGTFLTVGAWAQTARAGQDGGAVNAQTRQQAAARTLQPAGQAPDPVGGDTTRASGAKGTTHHRHHGHQAKHRNRSAEDQGAARPAIQTADPMTEPKK